jgi:integrase
MAAKYPGVQLHRGTLRIWFTWNGQRCFEPLNLEPTPNHYTAAARLRREISEKIKYGLFDYADYFPDSPRAKQQKTAVTFGEMSGKWLGILTDKSPSTINGYRKIINHYLLPKLGQLPIADIKYTDLKLLLAGFDVSAKTRNNIMSVIRQIFDIAFIDGEIDTNPTEKLVSAKLQKEPPDPFTLNEAEQILDHLGTHYPEPIRNYFELAFFAGLRTSELIALQWGDIDWQAKTLRVQRAKVLQQIKSTKTYVVRDVELNSRAIEAMKRQKLHTFLASEWIFLNPNTGKPFIDDRPVRRWAWTPTLKKLGIRHRPAYNTRHTCATLMLMAGSNPAWAAKQLGHSIKMFLETYSRWIDGDDKGRELSKMEHLLASKTSKCAPDVHKISK